MVVTWVFVDSNIVKSTCEPLKKRFLIGDGAENDLVIDTLHDVLCQIGLDAAQDLRFILISIHGSISKISLCYLVSACENHCNSLFVELRSTSPSDLPFISYYNTKEPFAEASRCRSPHIHDLLLSTARFLLLSLDRQEDSLPMRVWMLCKPLE